MHLLVLLLTLFAFSPLQANLRVISGDLGLGYRQDNLDWSVAGYNNIPNIVSELEWRQIKSCEVSGSLALAYNSIYVRGAADYGRIFSGRQRDSDYDRNNRTDEFMRSRATSDKGEVFDLSAGIGCVYAWGPFTFAPLAGWSLEKQNLRDRKAITTRDRDNPAFLGPICRFHSQYYAKWEGPWVGFDTSWHPLCHWLVKGSLEYHWANYNGRAHWNVRRDFKGREFKQKADGYGVLGSLHAEYVQTDHFSWGVAAVYRKFKTRKGRDRKVFIQDREGRELDPPETVDFRFNGVHWDSLSLKLYVSYGF